MISAKIESECNNGMTAMISAFKCYNSSNESTEIENSDVMKDIGKYNEFDVKVLSEILYYLRKNNS